MEYRGQKIDTGMQLLGCVIGDYAKTAINTGIFTGKTIGVCSMVYGLVTTNVPSFSNYARSFGQVTEAPAEVMITAQARMFARRNVKQRPCDAQLIRDMYALTAKRANSPTSRRRYDGQCAFVTMATSNNAAVSMRRMRRPMSTICQPALAARAASSPVNPPSGPTAKKTSGGGSSISVACMKCTALSACCAECVLCFFGMRVGKQATGLIPRRVDVIR